MRDKIVEEIITLETNYQLLSVERQRYILAMDKLDILESTIVSKMRIISMNLPKSLPEALKGWLHGLSNNFGDISGIAEESRHRMNYTLLKRDVIRRIFKDWGKSMVGLIIQRSPDLFWKRRIPLAINTNDYLFVSMAYGEKCRI